MHVIAMRRIGPRPEHRREPPACGDADGIDRGTQMLIPIGLDGQRSAIRELEARDVGRETGRVRADLAGVGAVAAFVTRPGANRLEFDRELAGNERSDVRSVLLMLGLLGALSLSAQSATACDEQRIRDDAAMCFSNPQHDGFGDLVLGSCRKDADLTRKGFRDCGGGLDNYDSCAVGAQIDDIRAAGMNAHIFSKPAACGF